MAVVFPMPSCFPLPHPCDVGNLDDYMLDDLFKLAAGEIYDSDNYASTSGFVTDSSKGSYPTLAEDVQWLASFDIDGFVAKPAVTSSFPGVSSATPLSAPFGCTSVSSAGSLPTPSTTGTPGYSGAWQSMASEIHRHPKRRSSVASVSNSRRSSPSPPGVTRTGTSSGVSKKQPTATVIMPFSFVKGNLHGGTTLKQLNEMILHQ
mmetsp:Transcript_25940/g.56521  ORF Transcript_25940/g.56521 Transcript_25940/m.56521 type:complete len:205 (+) Transcript_25940:101-715(+)|eukprot:CAMPEP_0202900162 /NCGR_PEP_ID=MMETSP1392-20130828/10176_1 /ASSEMBLY_ACC=CAM_ASM_000868 /TAXON_ID=225041 /ORGANISM="Chlamydomonas chlamydogama, Strain SAG 11-48b" /LENGTH=204 /DNA_ID=CAMNT_0049586497 /DNA_START=80 /DNA_END=694 /DNA_ORIENTATION=-